MNIEQRAGELCRQLQNRHPSTPEEKMAIAVKALNDAEMRGRRYMMDQVDVEIEKLKIPVKNNCPHKSVRERKEFTKKPAKYCNDCDSLLVDNK